MYLQLKGTPRDQVIPQDHRVWDRRTGEGLLTPGRWAFYGGAPLMFVWTEGYRYQ